MLLPGTGAALRGSVTHHIQQRFRCGFRYCRLLIGEAGGVRKVAPPYRLLLQLNAGQVVLVLAENLSGALRYKQLLSCLHALGQLRRLPRSSSEENHVAAGALSHVAVLAVSQRWQMPAARLISRTRRKSSSKALCVQNLCYLFLEIFHWANYNRVVTSFVHLK